MTTLRTLATLRRRLALAELDLLRQVAADQAARIEILEDQIERLERAADAMQARAELWEDNYFAAADERAAPPCLAKDGRVSFPVTH